AAPAQHLEIAQQSNLETHAAHAPSLPQVISTLGSTLRTTLASEGEAGGTNMNTAYKYRDVLDASERINWKVGDIIGGDKRLDFGKRFLPDSLARVEALEFLTEAERRTLNQIRGHEYLAMFGLVEEFIVPFVLDHARAQIHGPSDRVRA